MSDIAPSVRGRLLAKAIVTTCVDRQSSYGHPADNFETIAAFKHLFWNEVRRSGKPIMQNSAFGHAIDMVLTNLARIATSPDLMGAFAEDRYVDGAAYLALAYEMTERVTAENDKQP